MWIALEMEAGALCSGLSIPCLPEPCVYLVFKPSHPDWSGKSCTSMLLVQIPYAFCIYNIAIFVLKSSKLYNDLLITKIISLPVIKYRTFFIFAFIGSYIKLGGRQIHRIS